MKARGINNAALAEKAGVSPAYITKVMRGTENFTLETMSKLALAVNGKVRIHVCDRNLQTQWIDIPIRARAVSDATLTLSSFFWTDTRAKRAIPASNMVTVNSRPSVNVGTFLTASRL